LLCLLRRPLHLALAVLAHDLLKAVSFDELHSVFLVDLVDWNSFVLESEEKVDKLADFVSIVGLLLFQLLQFAFILLKLHHQVQFILGYHGGWGLQADRLPLLLLLGDLDLLQVFDGQFLLLDTALGLHKLLLSLLQGQVMFVQLLFQQLVFIS